MSSIHGHLSFAQSSSRTYEQCVPGYLFDVYENDRLVAKKVWLWINATKASDGSQLVECNLIYILVDHEGKALSLEAHHYSNTDGTLSNIEIDSKRIAFDIALSWLVPGRSMRVACDGSSSAWRYEVRAVALWTDIGATGTTRVDWKQVDEVKLPYNRLVVPFLELKRDEK
jgi:hypothetical protein